MKKLLLLSFIAIATFSFSVVPVGAQITRTGDPDSNVTRTPDSEVTCPDPKNPKCTTSSSTATGFDINIKLNNPLKVNSISEAVKFFMTAIIKIAIPIIVIFFLWSGLSFILAVGNPEKIKKAKLMFLYTIIGTLLILGAWTITNAIIGTVNTLAK